MDEDEKVLIDVRKLLPQVAKRINILESLYKNWASVIGAVLSRHSKPYDMIKNDLYIAVDTTHTAQMISNMKGNISRVLANRYNYHEDIELKITIWDSHKDNAKRQPAKNNAKSKQAVNISVSVDDSLVNEYINECPDTLPGDAKFAMSHLMAYLENVKRVKASG